MTVEPSSHEQVTGTGGIDEPGWRVRLRAAVERTVRQRAARARQRQAITARRTAGLQTRLATRLARSYDDPRQPDAGV
jgi:hypothetical protein